MATSATLAETLGEPRHEWFPARIWLPRYRRRWLRGDIAAGAVVAALAIPQSLGYAAIAGLPVQAGLYSLPTVLVCYALLGTSRLLIVGPVSTVAVLTGSLIASRGPANVEEAMAIASGTALAAGGLLILASFLKVGWVAEFLSKPIVTGFVMGLTILVIIGELPNILGIPVAPGSVTQRIHDLVTGLDLMHPETFAVGASALAVLFVGSRLAPRVPWALVVLLGGLIVSSVLDLAASGVAVVGQVPQGLPTPALPGIGADDLRWMVGAGAAVAFVGLAEGLSASRLFAAGKGERVDAGQDLLAFGAANLSSGVIGGFSVAGSLSKTAAAERAGGRSQVTGLTTAVLALATILFLAPLLSDLPKAVLSAIVIHAVWGLMDVGSFRRYARLRRNDFIAATVAALGVLAFGPLQGLLLAILLSVFGLVYRSSRVDVEEMARVPGEKAAYGSTRNHPERRQPDRLLILRVDVPLFWVNAASVKDAILALVDRAIAREAAKGPDHELVALILDLEGTDQIDTTTVDMLDSLLAELRTRCVDLYMVRVMYQVRLVLRHSGLVAKIGEDHLWHSISQGLRQARIHYALKEGVVDAAGGYDTAEEHEERIVPHYFADSQTSQERTEEPASEPPATPAAEAPPSMGRAEAPPSEAQLSGALTSVAGPSEAQLSGALTSVAGPSEAQLSGARTSVAQPSEAQPSEAQLSGALTSVPEPSEALLSGARTSAAQPSEAQPSGALPAGALPAGALPSQRQPSEALAPVGTRPADGEHGRQAAEAAEPSDDEPAPPHADPTAPWMTRPDQERAASDRG